MLLSRGTVWASWALEHKLSGCGAWVQVLRGMWDFPGSGMEAMSPVLAGKFLSTLPLGKLEQFFFNGHGFSGSAAGVGHGGKGLFLFYNFWFFIWEDLIGWVTCQLVAGIT